MGGGALAAANLKGDKWPCLGRHGVGRQCLISFWAHTKLGLRSVCMFDKFHLMFSFKSRVLRDVFKNKNERQLTSMSSNACEDGTKTTQHSLLDR